jgi:hypothetical protein
MTVLLLFPPSWTLNTGSPHSSPPLLRGYLECHGIETVTCDLNWAVASSYGVRIGSLAAREACQTKLLAEMNEAYFGAEDRLMSVARNFQGEWNAQVGFEYASFSHESSRQAIDAASKLSPFTEYFKDSVVPFVARTNPRLIGFCLASVYQIIPSLQLCGLLREAGYTGFVVLGGNTVSRLAKEMALPSMFKLVDGLITFQGEVPLLQLCRSLRTGKPLEHVPQLIYRDRDRIRFNSRIAELDPNSVPPPDYTDLPVGQYWGENYLNIVAARGCYYGKCSFCAIPYGWGNGGFTGIRSPELVYRDMLGLMDRHGINRFKFVDEALSPALMRALAERIVSDGVRLEWEGYVRLEPAWYDRSFVELVGRAGFRKGYFGLELVPSDRRSVLNKKDNAKPEALLAHCSSAGIKVHFFCMFGYPGTGEREAERTVEFLLKHQHLVDTADIFPWTYTKHTTVQGVEPIRDPERDWALEFRHAGASRDVLSSEEIVEMASKHEELIWKEVPRFLHPTYRLVSPWSPVTTGCQRELSCSSGLGQERNGEPSRWQPPYNC